MLVFTTKEINNFAVTDFKLVPEKYKNKLIAKHDEFVAIERGVVKFTMGLEAMNVSLNKMLKEEQA